MKTPERAALAQEGILPSDRSDRLKDLYINEGAGASRLATFLTRDADAAQDVVQEAFVRIARHLFALRSPDHARAYLYRTVINVSHSRGRSLRRDRQATPIERAESEAPVDVGERDELWNALRALPVRQRAALFLRYYLDESEAQAAETLDCSVSAMKSLVNRGLSALRAELEGGSRG